MEKLSFQAPPLIGVWVFDSQVIFASARDFEARFFKRLGQHGTIRDQTLIYLITDPAVERLTSHSAIRCLSHLFRLGCTSGIHWIGPVVFLVHQITQAIKSTFISWRCDVQATLAMQFHARCAEMQLNAVFVRVPNPHASVLVTIETGERQLFETINDLLLFFFIWLVAFGKADHTSAVAPLVWASVDQVGHDRSIPTKNLRQWITGDVLWLSAGIADQIAVLIIGKNSASRQIIDRSCTATFAVGKKLDQHHDASRWASMICPNCRSIPTMTVVTRSASICDA